jgi:hypothetical protein
VYSEDAKNEINRNLGSREAYTDPAGGFRVISAVDTIALVLRNMTGEYPTST